MIEIFRNRDSATVGQFQSLLESEGIRTYLRNEYVSATTIAIPEVTPALCILNEADLDRSVELIRSYIEAPPDESLPELPCPKCGEKSPATFAVCWNCGNSMEVS
ncbi:MAG: DUF2007 domain-containing protein [Verrucomicrobiota bacterium]